MRPVPLQLLPDNATVQAHGALAIVDGAQAVGQIRVDVKDLNCDAYAASPHKWLLAPKGTGILYIKRDVQPRIWKLRAPSSTGGRSSGGPDTSWCHFSKPPAPCATASSTSPTPPTPSRRSTRKGPICRGSSLTPQGASCRPQLWIPSEGGLVTW